MEKKEDWREDERRGNEEEYNDDREERSGKKGNIEKYGKDWRREISKGGGKKI